MTHIFKKIYDMIENTIKEIHTKNEVEILELNNSIIYIKSLMDGQGIGNS